MAGSINKICECREFSEGSAQESRLPSSLCALSISLFLLGTYTTSYFFVRCPYLVLKPVPQSCSSRNIYFWVIGFVFKIKNIIVHVVGRLRVLSFIILAISTVNTEKYPFCLWDSLLFLLNSNKPYGMNGRIWFVSVIKYTSCVIRHYSHKPCLMLLLYKFLLACTSSEVFGSEVLKQMQYMSAHGS